MYKYDYDIILKLIYLLNRLEVSRISHICIPMVITLPTPMEFIDFTFTTGPHDALHAQD